MTFAGTLTLHFGRRINLARCRRRKSVLVLLRPAELTAGRETKSPIRQLKTRIFFAKTRLYPLSLSQQASDRR
jgi:hypothetical protein